MGLSKPDSQPKTVSTSELLKKKNSSSLNSLEPKTLPPRTTKNSNELLMKNPKLRLLLPTPSRPVDTTTTCSENSTKRSRKLKLNSSDSSLKPMPRLLLGGPSTRPMLSNEPRSSKMPRKNWLRNSRKWKKWSNPPRPNAPLLKRPNSDKWAKSKISKSILNEPTPPLLLSTRNSETSTRSLPNTNRKKKNFRLNLNLLRKKPDPCPLNCSRLRMLTKKLLTALKPLNEKTRTSK